MQIVINVSDYVYRQIKNGFYIQTYDDELIQAVTEVTPLPKGHNRLVDVGDLSCDDTCFDNLDTYNDYCLMCDIIDSAPTIIPADGEQEGR